MVLPNDVVFTESLPLNYGVTIDDIFAELYAFLRMFARKKMELACASTNTDFF